MNTMKTSTFIFCFVLLCFNGNSQIVDSLNSWNYLEQYIPVRKKNADDMGVISENHGFSIGKDTLINSKDYKILYEKVPDPFDTLRIRTYTRGFLRDEENHKKVYLHNTDVNDSAEVLIYDFTLKKDSIFTSSYKNTTLFSAKVTAIDSIEFFSVKRLRIRFDDYFSIYPANGSYVEDTTEWIEGIGSNHAFFAWRYAIGGLLCFKQNGDMQYFNNYDYDCNFSSVTDNVTNESKDFILFPNPLIDGLLTIQSSVPMKTIAIFNINGIKIGEYFPNNTSYQLQLNSLKSGVYIICIDNGFRKIIIE
jgi:hypothetical protein